MAISLVENDSLFEIKKPRRRSSARTSRSAMDVSAWSLRIGQIASTPGGRLLIGASYVLEPQAGFPPLPREPVSQEIALFDPDSVVERIKNNPEDLVDILASNLTQIPDPAKLQLWSSIRISQQQLGAAKESPEDPKPLPTKFVSAVSKIAETAWEVLEPDVLRIATDVSSPDNEALSGNAVGFIYERYRDPFKRIVAFSGVPASEAEDVTVEVFAQLPKLLSGFKYQSPFGRWLNSVARYRALNYHRSQKKRKGDRSIFSDEIKIDMQGFLGIEDADVQKISNLESEWMSEALSKLTARQREVLIYQFGEGMTTREIANKLGMKMHNIQGLSRRGRAQLKRLVKVNLDGKVEIADPPPPIKSDISRVLNFGLTEREHVALIRKREQIAPLGEGVTVLHLTDQSVINASVVGEIIAVNPQLERIEISPSMTRLLSNALTDLLAKAGVAIEIVRARQGKHYDGVGRRGNYEEKKRVLREALADPEKSKLLLFMHRHGFKELQATLLYFGEEQLSMRQVAERLGIPRHIVVKDIDGLVHLLGYPSKSKMIRHSAAGIKRAVRTKAWQLNDEKKKMKEKQSFAVEGVLPPAGLPKYKWSEWQEVMQVTKEDPEALNRLNVENPKLYDALAQHLLLPGGPSTIQEVRDKYGVSKAAVSLWKIKAMKILTEKQ